MHVLLKPCSMPTRCGLVCTRTVGRKLAATNQSDHPPPVRFATHLKLLAITMINTLLFPHHVMHAVTSSTSLTSLTSSYRLLARSLWNLTLNGRRDGKLGAPMQIPRLIRRPVPAIASCGHEPSLQGMAAPKLCRPARDLGHDNASSGHSINALLVEHTRRYFNLTATGRYHDGEQHGFFRLEVLQVFLACYPLKR